MQRKAFDMLARDEDILAAAEAWREAGRERRDRDRRRNLGLRAAPGRLASGHRRRRQFPRLGFGRLRRGRSGRGGARRDRGGRAATCWNSASPTRRPGASAFPAAAASRSMSRGSTDAARRPEGDERGAARAARRRARHPTLPTANSGSSRPRRSATTRLREAIETALRAGKSGTVERRRRRAIS